MGLSYRVVDRLSGKVAVVTGAGGGLGRALTAAFAREGAAVVCQDVVASAADAAAEGAGRGAIAWTCDVTDAAAVEAMFAAAAERFGPVDVLVNNAGVDRTPGDGAPELAGLEQLLAMSDESWDAMLAVHVTGAFYCSRAMIRRLLEAERPGSIVCMSSIVALGGAGAVHYATAKAALHGLVRSIGRWGGPHGIRANAICPGMISTPMTDAQPDDQEWVRRRTPLGRIGLPADVAALAVYLASDESSFVTCQSISPNGGFLSS